ncbi:MAG: hypothetical protein RIQ73_506, partial [Actinomycetota bacterium]
TVGKKRLRAANRIPTEEEDLNAQLHATSDPDLH